MTKQIRMLGLAFSASVLVVAPALSAQSYPDRPIRLVVGYSPGGTTDITARLIAPKLSEVLGQNVVVDNRAGAGSIIGTEIVAKAEPDGYTLLLADTTFSILPAVYVKPPFDAIKDFTPIGEIITVGNCLVVNPSLPVRTVKDLVALARAKPNTLTFGSGGIGTPLHLGGEQFKLAAKIDIAHVPYKGAGPAINDLIGGQITMIFPTLTNALPFITGGRLRALAVTGARRAHDLPDVPTMAEAGYPGVTVSSWFGLIAPARTPKPIVDRLETALAQVLKQQDVRDRFAAQQAEVTDPSTAAFVKFLGEVTAEWASIAKKANIKVE